MKKLMKNKGLCCAFVMALGLVTAQVTLAQGTLHWNRNDALTLSAGQSIATNVVSLPNKFAVLDSLVFDNTSAFTTTVSVATYDGSWAKTIETIGSYVIPPNTVRAVRPRPYTVNSATTYVVTNNVILTYTQYTTNYMGPYASDKLQVIFSTPQTNLTTRTTYVKPYVFAD